MKSWNNIKIVFIVFTIILINIVSYYHFFRIDVTNDKKYSLSKETKELLKSIDDIIYFKIYLHGDIPIEYKKLANETKYMLNEFRAYSKLIEYEFIDPSSLQNEDYKVSLQEELYNKGISPIPHRNYQNNKMEEFFIFPGIIGLYKSNETTVSLINETLMKHPELVIKQSIENLEYLLTNSIRTLQTKKKQTIGVIYGHGETTNNLIYSFKQLISEHYQIIDIEIKEQLSALKNIDCIIINDPKENFSEKDKFIIDQFIMNGGKSIWIMNNTNAHMDSLEKNNETIVLPTNNRNLDDLLFKYGVRINTDLVQDLQAAPIPIVTHYIDEKPQWSLFPWFFLPVVNPNPSHIITNNINPIKTIFPSSIDTINNNTKKTILLKTSTYSKTMDTPALINLETLKKEPKKSTFNSGEKNICILLTGPFESVFKNRINPTISQNPDIKFKDNILDNKMLIISDRTFINNQFFQGSALPIGFDKHTGTQYGNNDFIINSIDYLLNNEKFISIRSKNIAIRLLNQTKITDEKQYWQIINTIAPIIILSIIGLLIFIIRKRKYKL